MNVLIAYYSATGVTAKMAEYIAEGVRFSGNDAVVKNVEDIKDTTGLAGYDGYIFGSPTYPLDLPKPMKTFLDAAAKAGLEDKTGGAFGAYIHDVGYRHDNYAPAIILDILQKRFKTKQFELGALILKEEIVGTRDGMKACQDYGRVFGEGLSGDRL